MYTLTDIRVASTIPEQSRYLLLVGFALNGPARTPFTIKDGINPYELLGDCLLADAYVEARLQGIEPLVLRLNGNHATQTIKVNDVPIFTVEAVQGNTESNNIVLHVFPTHLSVKGLITDRTYLFSEYPTADRLVDAINFDADYGLGEIKGNALSALFPTKDLTDKEYQLFLEEGRDESHLVVRNERLSEVTIDERINLLRDTLLESYDEEYASNSEFSPFNIDTVILTDFAHELYPSATEILGKFCESKTLEQPLFCSGLIGSYLLNGEDDVTESVASLVEKGNKGHSHDYYKHVEVVLGTQRAYENEDKKIPVVTGFGAMRYLQASHLSATNKKISTILNLFARIRKEDVALLTSNGYTCIVPSIRKGFVAYKSTSFIENQQLVSSKPHYVRPMYEAISFLLDDLDIMIGSNISRLQMSKVTNLFNDKIRELVEKRESFKDIQYEVYFKSQDTIGVSLVFIPYGEVSSVQSNVLYDTARKAVVTWR